MAGISDVSFGFSPLRASLQERYGVASIDANVPPPRGMSAIYGDGEILDQNLPNAETLLLDLRARQIERPELLAIAARIPQCKKLER